MAVAAAAAAAAGPVAMDGPSSSGGCPLPTDLLLEVLAFVDAASLGRFAQCDRLLCVLAAEKQRQPAFTAVHGPVQTLAQTARERLPAAPDVGFLFCNTSVPTTSLTAALKRLPPKLKLIGARSRFPLLGMDVSTTRRIPIEAN
jgi:hypothetical protein